MNLDELDELEDDEDERVLQEYRQKRMLEMKAAAQAAKYGEVRYDGWCRYRWRFTGWGEGHVFGGVAQCLGKHIFLAGLH